MPDLCIACKEEEATGGYLCDGCAEDHDICTQCGAAENYVDLTEDPEGRFWCPDCVGDAPAGTDWQAEEAAVYRRSVGVHFG